MRFIVFIVAMLTFALAPASAQSGPATPTMQPIVIEHYYRIKWGSLGEFKSLYARNHAPLLAEMQKRGFLTNVVTHEPVQHMAGGQRWDLRVTITFRDAPTAIVIGGDYDKAVGEVAKRLYPDKAKFDAEEARRFSLVEEHWDVIVTKSD